MLVYLNLWVFTFSVLYEYLRMNTRRSSCRLEKRPDVWFCRRTRNASLTFSTPLVGLRTARLNVKKLCMLITLRLCVLCGSQNKK
jgi:hypothetical protein